MLKTLRDTAHFFDRRIGWSRLGFALSLTIIIVAVVVLYRILRNIDPDSLIDAIEALLNQLGQPMGCWPGRSVSFAEGGTRRRLGLHERPRLLVPLARSGAGSAADSSVTTRERLTGDPVTRKMTRKGGHTTARPAS